MSGKSLEVSIKPDVLVWARESLGISVEDVARRIKASIETINQWEFSKKNPTFKQLEKLSRIYRRPLAAFFLPSPPKEPPLPKDFRTLPPEKKKPISVKTRLAIRRARRLQELANKLAKSLKRGTKEVLDIAKTNENPEEIAVKIREELGISLKTQFEWGDEREALNNWISALEKTGILILQLGMPVKENRGFSLAEDHIKVIVINNQDAVRAKIFSLFHEYGHLLLRSSSLCDLEERFYQTSEIEKTEIFCNRFAGSFLVPKDALIQHDVLKSQKYNATGWTDNLLRELADDFKVSQERNRLFLLGNRIHQKNAFGKMDYLLFRLP